MPAQLNRKVMSISISIEKRRGETKQLIFTGLVASIVSDTLVTGALAIIIGLSFWLTILSVALRHRIGALIMAFHSVQDPMWGNVKNAEHNLDISGLFCQLHHDYSFL